MLPHVVQRSWSPLRTIASKAQAIAREKGRSDEAGFERRSLVPGGFSLVFS